MQRGAGNGVNAAAGNGAGLKPGGRKQKMKRTIEIEKTYRTTAEKAIKKFFKAHEELYYWEETFEYMLANNLNHFSDEIMGDNTKNTEWCYSLWLYPEGDTTYICVIERE